MTRLKFLTDPKIRAALKQAWKDSQPGVTGGHEEGGFIVMGSAGHLDVIRWPKGTQSAIILPSHLNCKVGNKDIIATFHTHPNTGNDYLQEPSETDKRAVRDDSNLKGEYYEGEIIISQKRIYLIAPHGQVTEVGDTQEILSETPET